MGPRARSIAGFVLMVAALLALAARGELFATGPVSIAMQAAAALLMLWARAVFGARSFHAAANPTSGGLVTRGPYALVWNPIYAAVLLFLAGALAAHPGWVGAAALAVATAGVLLRVQAEERELAARYGAEYEAYRRHVRRLVPFVV